MGYQQLLLKIYERLYQQLGPSHWWPAETNLEVMVGAILTQNTAWRNVEKAIVRLKEAKILSYDGLLQVDDARLSQLIQPAGFYRQKTQYLKNLIYFLRDHCKGNLKQLFEDDVHGLRKELLNIKGVGYETADSILLYAGNMPLFVIDAYTKRVFSRLKLMDEKTSYQKAQEFFMINLPTDVQLFNEYHALIVRLCHTRCLKKPCCEDCPLIPFCLYKSSPK
ncbi:MAG: hypothetical protein HY730_07905 [Candidatus Tectomicrobia bacterium]|uniref:HhH-GPD domain-containing protein n=1 Tax=Tectimicrobiota bacterium TaxID=2528274 RepID=A0A933LRD9_UNCTE|nr:hypothetical protein [Candidatus Tectomicrobia bacterium]